MIETDKLFPFAELYSSWERWCEEEEVIPKQRPTKKEIKTTLISIQEKSKYGFMIGKTNADGAPNGTKRSADETIKIGSNVIAAIAWPGLI